MWERAKQKIGNKVGQKKKKSLKISDRDWQKIKWHCVIHRRVFGNQNKNTTPAPQRPRTRALKSDSDQTTLPQRSNCIPQQLRTAQTIKINPRQIGLEPSNNTDHWFTFSQCWICLKRFRQDPTRQTSRKQCPRAISGHHWQRRHHHHHRQCNCSVILAIKFLFRWLWISD